MVIDSQRKVTVVAFHRREFIYDIVDRIVLNQCTLHVHHMRALSLLLSLQSKTRSQIHFSSSFVLIKQPK